MRIMGWSILSASLVMLAAIGFIQTAPGKAWLARTVSRLASDGNAKNFVTIDTIDGNVPWDMRIASIRLSDADGEYASLRGLHLAWNPLALLGSHIAIHALEADEITVARAPHASSAPVAPQQPFSLPRLPHITLRKLAIGTLHLSAAFAGSEQSLTLDGGGAPEDYHLSLTTMQGPPTSLTLALHILPQSLRMQAVMDEAPGGVALHLLKQAEGEALHMALDATTDAEGIVHVNKAEGLLGKTSFSGNGDYALDNSFVKGGITVLVPRMEQFSRFAQSPLTGAANVKLTANGPLNALETHADASLTDFAVNALAVPHATAHVEALFNTVKNTASFTLNSDAVVNAVNAAVTAQGDMRDDTLTLATMEAIYGDYRGRMQGDAHFKNRTFALDVIGKLPPLSVILPQLHAQAVPEVNAHLKGSFERFHVTSDLAADSNILQARVKAEGDIEPMLQKFSGELNGDFTREGHNFSLHAPVTADKSQIALSDASFKGDGFSLSATLHWAVEQALAEGSLALDAPDLRPLGLVLGQALSGRASLKAEMKPHEGAQTLTLSGDATHITANGATLAGAELKAALQDAKSASSPVSLHFSAGPISSGDTRVENITLTAKGALKDQVALNVSASGMQNQQPFSLQLAAHADKDAEDTLHFALETLKGVYNHAALALARPARLTLARDRSELSPLTISLAGGTVSAQGSVTAHSVSGSLRASHIMLEKIPVAALPSGLAGGEIILTGTADKPVMAFNNTVAMRYGQQTVNARVKGTWHNDSLAADMGATMDKAKLTAALNAGAAFSLSPFVMGLTAQSTVKGKASLSADMETFNTFLQAGGSRVGGQILANAAIAGTLSAPDIRGRATLANGQYYFQDAGVCMKGITAQLSSDGKNVTLDTLHGSTDNGGALQAHASVMLDAGKTVDGTIRFTNYRLFCGGLASGTIDGTLAATGTTQAAALRGVLTFPHMNVEIPGATPRQAAIPTVATVRVDPRTGKPARAFKKSAAEKEPLMLDVSLHVPNRLFVQGRGLDAEFAGDLAITGPATSPVVTGGFSTKRGSFTLLDRKLKLTSGTLRFEGPIPPSPFLDVNAESTVNSTTITVALSGPAAKPVVTFTSTPSLPPDEVLAMLLFNRSLSSLGPFQVAQLAQATAELAGYGGGPGMLSKVQKKLGIDTLDVGTDTGNNVNVGAGKYITDKIYVGVTQGAKSDSRAVTTEIEVRPHISATSGVSSDGQQNIGLQWKYDY